MDPKHLLYLSVVLEKGSLTEAAKHLAVTQPTLTRIMATLEMQAGSTLFSRSRYGVKGSELGEALAREGRAIQQNVELAQAIASRHRIGLDKELRIGVGPLLAATLMPQVLNEFMQQLPRQSLAITVLRPTALIDLLLEHQLDFVIAPAPPDRVISGSQRLELAEDNLSVYAASNHYLANKSPLSIADFADAHWLSLGHANPFERQVMELLSTGGVSKIRTQVVFRNDGALLLEVLSHGRHLAVLPDLPIKAANQSQRFVRLDFNAQQTSERNLYLWVRDPFKESDVAKTLYLLLKQHFARYS